ncbi:uncharacterized protein LOC133906744 [Phragmites australis]|uniref:uncharacterized protein LOC133906744 n=1 Tax=Phragmites australis TaxID=29695 RepID=UPI002D78CF81|nr:uncharacterized protein LOC133906744 [Phragmites australis]
MERSSGGAGSCLGLVAVAVVSTSIILISYQLHRRLEADLRAKIGEGAEARGARRRRRKKKVRFADDVVEPSSNNEEYRRRARSIGTVAPAPSEAADPRPAHLPSPCADDGPSTTHGASSMRERAVGLPGLW